jgi:hypothetical protein
MQRWRSETLCSDGPCILASLYGDVMKEMKLASGAAANSTHEFVCDEYCPLLGPFHSSVQIGNIDPQSSPVTYLGKATATQQGSGAESKQCDVYEWSELLFHLVPMQTTDFFVDTSGGKPVPFYSSTSLFKALFDVKMNQSFLDFAVANLTGKFDIDPASFSSCRLSPGCNAQDESHRPQFRTGQAFRKPMPMQRVKSALPAVTPIAKLLPVISRDYVAREETRMLQNSGGTMEGDGDVCCTPSTTSINGECFVQRSAKRGTRYMDVTNQRVRFEDEISGKTMVTIYGSVHKDMLLETKGGIEYCSEFCPLLSEETLEPLSLDPNATDMGAATVPSVGGKAERFQWFEYAKIPITGKMVKMETVDFYAQLGTMGDGAVTATPIFELVEATPYGGPPTGTQNTTYSHFVSGTPPAAKFDIHGIDTCPQAKNCQLEMWQAFRLAAGRFDAFYYYQR